MIQNQRILEKSTQMPHSVTDIELEASWSPKVTRLHVTEHWSALVKLFAPVRGKMPFA